MKEVLSLLHNTSEIRVPHEPLKTSIRELEMSELGLVSGGQRPNWGTCINVSVSKSAGANDDCLDGSDD